MFGSLFKSMLKKIKKHFAPKPIKQGRPHFYSKNAWSYVSRNQQTVAMRLLLSLGAL